MGRIATKRRAPLTYHRSLTVIASRIGWDGWGAICGVADRTVRYLSDPDCKIEIRLIDAERLGRAFIAAGDYHAPFHRLFALRLKKSPRAMELTAASPLLRAFLQMKQKKPFRPSPPLRRPTVLKHAAARKGSGKSRRRTQGPRCRA